MLVSASQNLINAFLTVKVSAAALMAAANPTGEHGADPHAVTQAGEGAFPPFDPAHFLTQIFWLLLTFGLLYFLLARVFLPQVSGTLEERSNRIADDLDSAARMQREAEQAIKNYERALADAKVKAHNVAETTRSSVEAEIMADTEAADAEAARHTEAADLRIRKSRNAAMANIDDIAIDVAQAAIDRLTGKKMTKSTLRRVIVGG